MPGAITILSSKERVKIIFYLQGDYRRLCIKQNTIRHKDIAKTIISIRHEISSIGISETSFTGGLMP